MRDEEMPVVVEVDPPLVAAAARKNLELVTHRMITPDTGIQAQPLARRCTGFANERFIEHAVIAVQPAVRPPRQAVRCLMRVLITPAVEQNFRLGVGHVIAVAIRNKKQMRRGAKPHAAETHFDAADEVQVFGKNLPRLKRAIGIRVLKNHHAVTALADWLALRIAVRLDHPQTTARVEGESDRLRHFRLARDEIDAKPFRHPDAAAGRVIAGIGLEMLQDGTDPARRLNGGGLLVVKTKVVEIYMPPRAGGLVHHVDEDFFAAQFSEVHRHRAHVLHFPARGSKKDFPIRRLAKLHSRGRLRAAAHEKAAPRMRHLKLRGSQRALPCV